MKYRLLKPFLHYKVGHVFTVGRHQMDCIDYNTTGVDTEKTTYLPEHYLEPHDLVTWCSIGMLEKSEDFLERNGIHKVGDIQEVKEEKFYGLPASQEEINAHKIYNAYGMIAMDHNKLSDGEPVVIWGEPFRRSSKVRSDPRLPPPKAIDDFCDHLILTYHKDQRISVMCKKCGGSKRLMKNCKGCIVESTSLTP